MYVESVKCECIIEKYVRCINKIFNVHAYETYLTIHHTVVVLSDHSFVSTSEQCCALLAKSQQHLSHSHNSHT